MQYNEFYKSIQNPKNLINSPSEISVNHDTTE